MVSIADPRPLGEVNWADCSEVVGVVSLRRMVFSRFWLDMRRRLTLSFVDNLSRQG